VTGQVYGSDGLSAMQPVNSAPALSSTSHPIRVRRCLSLLHEIHREGPQTSFDRHEPRRTRRDRFAPLPDQTSAAHKLSVVHAPTQRLYLRTYITLYPPHSWE
jgi:hypothetical protein